MSGSVFAAKACITAIINALRMTSPEALAMTAGLSLRMAGSRSFFASRQSSGYSRRLKTRSRTPVASVGCWTKW